MYEKKTSIEKKLDQPGTTTCGIVLRTTQTLVTQQNKFCLIGQAPLGLQKVRIITILKYLPSNTVTNTYGMRTIFCQIKKYDKIPMTMQVRHYIDIHTVSILKHVGDLRVPLN